MKIYAKSADSEDQIGSVTHASIVPLPAEPDTDDGDDQVRRRDDPQTELVAPSSVPNASGDTVRCLAPKAQATSVSSLATIEAIIVAHRQRNYWMEARKRQDLSLGAYLRSTLGWSMTLPKAESDRIKTQAKTIVALGEKYIRDTRRMMAKAAKDSAGSEGQKMNVVTHFIAVPLPVELEPFADIVLDTIAMRASADNREAHYTAQMEDLVETLPVWKTVKDWRGVGPLGVAIIVAEAGRDLNCYATKGKIFKRLGLAVLAGVRQGGLPKSASKEAWIEHAYPRQRRSRVWTVATSVLLAKNERYTTIYHDRKAYERAAAEAIGLTVAPSAKIPKKRAAEFRSLGHIDNRARRYAEKKLICDIWRAWRAA